MGSATTAPVSISFSYWYRFKIIQFAFWRGVFFSETIVGGLFLIEARDREIYSYMQRIIIDFIV